MKRALVLFIAVLMAGTCVSAQMGSMSTGGHEKPATLLPGLGAQRHPVSTRNAMAQKFFDQGLRLIYAFNHDEAVRSFKRAAELDPNLAMAYWGIGYAMGPNINQEVEPEREKAAYEATQKALALKQHASPKERAYIDALTKRYSIDPQADLKKRAGDFANAMGELSKLYPDDLDAATLYAESMMDLRPWQLWTNDGQPAEGTLEIVAVLESVLKRNPRHIGAVHYYIHAVEASPDPGRALPYVAYLPAQMPSAGHLVHMPAHTYIRTGDFLAAALSNRDAIVADDAYIKRTGATGLYTTMYYNHNIHFLAAAYGMAGNYARMRKASQQLQRSVGPHLKEMPMLEGFMLLPIQLLLRFRRWDEVLRLPQPEPSFLLMNTHWRYARAVAYANKGQIAEAEQELEKFHAVRATVPASARCGLNLASDVAAVAEQVMIGQIALAKKDTASAVDAFTKAIEAEDRLSYNEPKDWISPVREMLGGVLLRSGDAAGAEKIFRADLKKNPKNGRSLFGLSESLKAQGKTREAAAVRRQFALAWRTADTKLSVGAL
jgi:tetratricopeptide (TPR) repeat protein